MVLRCAFLVLALALFSARGDDVLFIGNSFTFGATAPAVEKNGGVPKLFEEIANAKGKHVAAFAVTKGGQNWAYHLAQPETAAALKSKAWTWVVLQDFSQRATHVGDVAGFMRDGETFSGRIAENSPHGGILLYETWARPAGKFYAKTTWTPAQMIEELHENYAKLRDDLAAKNPARDVRVAMVGTAFARCQAEHPEIILDASDDHHATAAGYYLAALVMYETIYRDSPVGAPTKFFHDELSYPADQAEKLQKVADEVAAVPAK